MAREPFTPATSTEYVKGSGRGPICECPSNNCKVLLPPEAWRYVVIGQYVCAPGHEPKRRQAVAFPGFCVYET